MYDSNKKIGKVSSMLGGILALFGLKPTSGAVIKNSFFGNRIIFFHVGGANIVRNWFLPCLLVRLFEL